MLKVQDGRRFVIVCVFAVMLVGVMALGFAPRAYADEGLGKCGPNLVASIDGSHTELTIKKASSSKSDGKMYDYSEQATPWSSYTYSIKLVIVKSGVTTLTAGAFEGMDKLEGVFLPKSLTSIKSVAFSETDNLTDVYWGGSMSAWDKFKGNISKTGNASLLAATVHCLQPAKPSIVKPKSGKKSITVKWKAQSDNVSGFEVQYSKKKNFKSAKKKTVNDASATSKKIKKLKSKKKYYVRVRAFNRTDLGVVYSSWSKAKKAKAK